MATHCGADTGAVCAEGSVHRLRQAAAQLLNEPNTRASSAHACVLRCSSAAWSSAVLVLLHNVHPPQRLYLGAGTKLAAFADPRLYNYWTSTMRESLAYRRNTCMRGSPDCGGLPALHRAAACAAGACLAGAHPLARSPVPHAAQCPRPTGSMSATATPPCRSTMRRFGRLETRWGGMSPRPGRVRRAGATKATSLPYAAPPITSRNCHTRACRPLRPHPSPWPGRRSSSCAALMCTRTHRCWE